MYVICSKQNIYLVLPRLPRSPDLDDNQSKDRRSQEVKRFSIVLIGISIVQSPIMLGDQWLQHPATRQLDYHPITNQYQFGQLAPLR